jgi:hypothetical protein
MDKYLKISILAFVLFVIYAPSCVDEEAQAIREESLLTGARNDIRAEFEADYLSEAALFAYESTAKQKLTDCIDYLHILADTSLDMYFRLKAGEMIESSFITENVEVQLSQPGDKWSKKLEIQKLVKKGLKDELSFLDFSVDSIRVIQPLQRTGDDSYSGKLRFSQNFYNPDNSGTETKTISRSLNVFVIKEDKIFGSDTLRVWSVKLGNIR